MSYILDALKKADAERERGSVPGLHSQPQSPAADELDSPRAALPWLPLAAGLGLALILFMAWQLWPRTPAPPSQPVAQQAEGQAAPPFAQPPALQPPAPEPMPAISAAPPMAPPPTADRPAPASRTTLTQPMRAPPDTPAPVATPAPEPPPTDATQAYNLHELPDDVRRELPTLVVGGAMYSDTPASRMLVINSQVLHEGDQAAPGVTLHEIRLKSAVFGYRGYRYIIKY